MRKVDISQVFGRNLKAEMKKAGLKQIPLAKKSGVSQGVISEISRGISSPTIETVNNLAHALGVQAWELLVDEPATRRAALERILGGH